MRLFGSKSNSKHSQHGFHEKPAADGGARAKSAGAAKNAPAKKSGKRKLIIIVCTLLAIALCVFAAIKIFVHPPEVTAGRNSDTAGSKTGGTSAAVGIDGDATAPKTDDSSGSRTGSKYTFVILGTDQGNGNTDTIMVVTFDTNNYTLNVVNIPRDTMVNVPWAVKKANTFYSSGGMEGVMDGLADILGYRPDFGMLVDMRAFVQLVDAVGGVDYYIPQKMDYEDPDQDLYIHFTAGQKHLDGKNALNLVRFRRYGNGDIGRISTQQDFLKSAATQILAKKDSLDAGSLVKVFLDYVQTDLTYGEVIWMVKEFYKVDSENINFYTVPGNYNDTVYQGSHYVSYVTISVNEWLDLINKYLNPFDDDITIEDLDILTRNSSGGLYATSGVRAGSSTWGSSKPASSSGGSSSSSGGSSSGGSSSGGSSSSGGGTSSGHTGTQTPPDDDPPATEDPPVENDPPEENDPPTGGEEPETPPAPETPETPPETEGD